MFTVNVNDRDSIRKCYPRAAFDHDARNNSDAKVTVHRGVRILSEPDANGDFQLAQAAEHVGEIDPEGDPIFLCPFLGDALDTFMEMEADYRAPVEKKNPPPDADYEGFIDRVIDTAKSAHFKDAIGRHEERLRGYHGG